MSISIYRPYFYIIQHIDSGKYYAGVKYGIKANPENLLKFNGYKTSSNIIKRIILEEGLESFIIRKIKVFETGEEALIYESRFLRRVDAAFNDKFLNRSNNSVGTLNVDYEKRKQACLEKYGFEYPMQSEEVYKKIKQTNLGRYGYECSLQNEEVKGKIKQTCLDRYGVEYPMQSEEIQEKSKQTCLDNYGVEYSSQSPEVRIKMKQTWTENLGVENPSQSEEIKEKKRQTWLGNLGVEYPMLSKEVQEKSRQTCLENLGVEYPSQSPEVRAKIKQRCLDKYGVENPSQSEEIKEKKRQTCNNIKNRPIVLEVRKYRDKFKLKLGNNWFWKSQDILDNMLLELKMIYGETEPINELKNLK